MVAALVMVLMATPTVLGLTSSSASAANAGLEAEFAQLTNSARSAAGLPPLAVDPALTTIAQGWSNVLLASGTLSHNTNVVGLLPAGWTHFGENVGEGPSAGSIQTAFMNSPEHKANILGPYSLFGIGVDVRSDGTIFVTLDFLAMGSASAASATPSCTDSNPPNQPSVAAAKGYYVLGNDGGIFSYGGAPFRGSVPGLGISARAVLMALTPDQGGYYVLGSDGGVFTFGDAHFYGSVPGTGSHAVGVDLKPTPDGRGYWILGQDGSVFSFGDAAFHGSLPTSGISATAVKLVPTPTGQGYWILGHDGSVYGFGDAAPHGSLPGAGVHEAAVSMASTPSGNGYWILGADGGIFSFGDAAFHGSVPGIGCQTAQGVQLIATHTGAGYYILSSDGRVFPFGDAPAYGEPSALHVTTLDLAVLHG